MPVDLMLRTKELVSQGTENIPVKNTFVHFEEIHSDPLDALFAEASAGRSAPPTMLNEAFHTKWPQHEAKHFKNECRPCAYYLKKADSCRRGGDCDFCHLCPAGALKARKKEKIQRLRQQQVVHKLAEMNLKIGNYGTTPSTSGSTTPSSGGDRSSVGSSPAVTEREPFNGSSPLSSCRDLSFGSTWTPVRTTSSDRNSWADICEAEAQRPWLGSAF